MEKTFTIKGNQITCTIAGNPDNPPIILIHGLGSHRGIWKNTISTLQSTRYCVAVDLLGFGASDKPSDGDYTLRAQSQRIGILADQLGFKNFSLLGHGMGGQISMYIAAALIPQRIDKLVTVAGIVTGKMSDRFEKFNINFSRNARKWPWLYSVANSFVVFRPFAYFFFKTWFHDVGSVPFDTWESDRRAALNPACSISIDDSGKAIQALDLTQHLRKIKANTLLIHGKQDGTVPLDQELLAQTLIPNNNLAIIEKCGHFPMYEKNSQFMKALALIF
jgi:pimeloyl-ACP methyl ester carboxylesterase